MNDEGECFGVGFFIGALTLTIGWVIAMDINNGVWRKEAIKNGCGGYDSKTGIFSHTNILDNASQK